MFFYKELTGTLLLKAKETSELSSETCSALHLCLELLSKQEEVRGAYYSSWGGQVETVHLWMDSTA